MRSIRAAAVACWAACVLGVAAAPAAEAVELPVWTRTVPDGRLILARNDYYAPMLLELELSGLRHAVGATASRITVLLPPRREVLVATIAAARPGIPPAFDYRAAYSLGDPIAQHDAAALYRLPYADGLRFVVSQAPGGDSPTHNTPDAAEAIDFAMPAGTRIVAARAGVVMQVVQHHGEGRADPAFLRKANLVRIVHDDGTWADYAHLQRGSVRVKPGQRVAAGDALALSGNSGYTSGPHLHFAVKRNSGGEIVSVPIRFHSMLAGVFTPHEGGVAAAVYGNQRAVAGLRRD